jgi:hypothetical protein
MHVGPVSVSPSKGVVRLTGNAPNRHPIDGNTARERD